MNRIGTFSLGFLLFFAGCSGVESLRPYKRGFFGGGGNTVKGNGRAFFKNIGRTFEDNRYKSGLFGGGRNKKRTPVVEKVPTVSAKKELEKPQKPQKPQKSQESQEPQEQQGAPKPQENLVSPPQSTISVAEKIPDKKEVLERLNNENRSTDAKLEVPQIPLVETVDVFALERPKGPQLVSSGESLGEVNIQEELDIYKQAESFYEQKQMDLALEKLKRIEYSTVDQIKVHVRFLMGEIMFEQGRYDLAMQNYKEVITHYAFSGLVIKSLERLVVCSKNLKEEEMRAKYHSILYNFFES